MSSRILAVDSVDREALEQYRLAAVGDELEQRGAIVLGRSVLGLATGALSLEASQAAAAVCRPGRLDQAVWQTGLYHAFIHYSRQ